jgi:hypothetical protein
MLEAPSITQTPTPKDPKNALKNAPSRHVYSDNIKHQNMQQYALQSSRSRMQARNLAPETNSGPDSAHRPAKPPPPQSSPPPYHAIRAIASNQKTNKATKKASFDLRNNNRMLVAISNNETAQNDAATEADGAAAGPAKRVTGMIGELDMILR